MVSLAPQSRNNFTRTFLYIPIMGIISGILLIANFYSYFFIGNGIIFTVVILLLIIMALIMKAYSVFMKKEMTFVNTLLVGLPVFIICTAIRFAIVDYYFEIPFDYSFYTNNYFMQILEGTWRQFIPLTLFFALIFAPVYRSVKKLKLNKVG